MLTLSLLKFWHPRQLYQPCGHSPEVLRPLPSTLLHCLMTKRTQNKKNVHFFLVNSNSDSHVNSTSHVDLDMRFWDEKIKLAWIFRHIYSIICELVTIKIAKIWDLYGYLFYGMSKFFTLGSALLSSLPKLISRCFHRILKLF